MRFFLGTHETSWMKKTEIPLFISRRRLARTKNAPQAQGPWSLDSGGFTELNMFGKWVTPPSQYADEVQQWQERCGKMQWAAIQDWMCEPFVLEKTGLSVQEHQARSVQSYLDLSALAPMIPWTPVLQGWNRDDYHAHVEQYRGAGVPLSTCPAVGVGSVCRRQGTQEAIDLFAELSVYGLALHGFGLKSLALKSPNIRNALASADSLAWSYQARRRAPLPGCKHKSCANCLRFALKWRAGIVERITTPLQLVMF
jgi:hypothetical protein